MIPDCGAGYFLVGLGVSGLACGQCRQGPASAVAPARLQVASHASSIPILLAEVRSAVGKCA